MTGTSLSDEADHLYRPFVGLAPWLGVPVDQPGWEEALDRPHTWRAEDPLRLAMADRGVRLAAAFASAAHSGAVPTEPGLVDSLIRGVRSPASLPDETRTHVIANYEALERAVAGIADDRVEPEALLREIHAVACRPQAAHPVLTAIGEQDHVLAHGDYKHHPNHARRADGSWRAFVPVAQLDAEMTRLEDALTGPAFAALHPIARAAFVLHAVVHVGPFAVGNGRTARALAGAHLVRAGAQPLVAADGWDEWERARDAADEGDPAPLVAYVAHRSAAAVELLAMARAEPDPAAIDRWRHRADAAARLTGLLPVAVDDALARHRRRPAVAWQSGLADAQVLAGPDAPTIRVPVGDGATVDETLAVDPHPLDDGDSVALRAAEAMMQTDVRAGDGLEALVPWLDLMVRALAVRVAAALE